MVLHLHGIGGWKYYYTIVFAHDQIGKVVRQSTASDTSSIKVSWETRIAPTNHDSERDYDQKLLESIDTSMILNELMSIVGDDSAGADEMRRIP